LVLSLIDVGLPTVPGHLLECPWSLAKRSMLTWWEVLHHMLRGPCHLLRHPWPHA